MNAKQLALTLDAAVLAPNLTPDEARAQIMTAIENECKTVCVRPCDLALAASLCKGQVTQASVVLGFPHGDQSTETKIAEAKDTMRHKPAEVDMVNNIGWARAGAWDLYEKEIAAIAQIVHAGGALLKVILETSQLTEDDIAGATRACVRAGADFVKTSTGFTGPGATVEAARVMLKAAEGRAQVKASGGIRNTEAALAYLEMGCTRLGVGVGSVTALLSGEALQGDGY